MSGAASAIRPRWIAPLAEGLAGFTERLTGSVLAAIDRPRRRDLLALLLVLAVAAYSVFHPYSAWRLVTGDALAQIQVLAFPALEFRPPPSNNLFPDVLLHMLVNPFVPDLLTQKFIVGWALILGSLLLIGFYRGPLAALAVMAIYATSGFEYVDSASHYTLPVMVLLYMLARPGWLRNGLLFLLVFSDVLIVVPLIVLLLEKPSRTPVWQTVAIVLAGGFCGEVLYSELSESLVQITVVASIFLIGSLIAKRLGLLRAMALAFSALLLVASVLGKLDSRYALTVSASLAVIYLDGPAPRFDWRYLALPGAMMAVFFATVNFAQYDRSAAQYDCLLDTLAQRGIGNIAADHWTAKPIYFAARQRQMPLTITQVNFRDNGTSLWMAPYDFAGAPTPYAVRSEPVCAMLSDSDAFCSQASVAPVKTMERICDGLQLFTYATPVPAHYVPRPASKLQSIMTNAEEYSQKLLAKFGL